MLCSALIPSLPKVTKDFVLYLDTSHQGLGCILMKRDKIISYTSWQLNVHEKTFTTHDFELGVVVFTLKIWRHYLYSIKCTIFTDHKSLRYLFGQKELNMRQRKNGWTTKWLWMWHSLSFWGGKCRGRCLQPKRTHQTMSGMGSNNDYPFKPYRSDLRILTRGSKRIDHRRWRFAGDG